MLFEVNDIVTLFGDEYKIVRSEATGNYYLQGRKVANNKIFDQLNIDALKLSCKVYGYTSSGVFPEAKTLEDLHSFYLVLANLVDNIDLIKYLQSRDALDAFIRNTDPNALNVKRLTIDGAFIWNCTPEGQEYWQSLDTEFNHLKHETQLQNETTSVRRDNDRTGNCICNSGNFSESSTRHSCYEARARKRKNALRSHKVYISTRCGCVHRS